MSSTSSDEMAMTALTSIAAVSYIRRPFVMCHELIVVCSVVGDLASGRDTLALHRFLTGLCRWSSLCLAEVGE